MTPAKAASFEVQTDTIARSYAAVLRKAVESLPQRPRTAADLKRATKLNTTLSWKVFRVIKAPDGLSASAYIPGTANLRTVMRACAKAGAEEGLLESLLEQDRIFQEHVVHHAGDRRTFDSMVARYGEIAPGKSELKARQAGFRAASQTFGAQMEAAVGMMALRANREDPTKVDVHIITAQYGVRRLRATALPLFTMSYEFIKSDREVGTEKPAPPSGMSLLKEYCSPELPAFMETRTSGGRVIATITPTNVGLKHSLNMVVHVERLGSGARYRTDEHLCRAFSSIVSFPMRASVSDMLIEPGLFGGKGTSGVMMTRRLGMDVMPEDVLTCPYRLVGPEAAEQRGRGLGALALPESPEYAPMVHRVLTEHGWTPETMEVVRYRVDYPVALSTVVLVQELAEARG